MSDTPPSAKRPITPQGYGKDIKGSRLSGLWVGMILSAVVLVFLLIFILQNRVPVQINFLAWTGALPTGIALLFSAVAGALLVALPGSARMLQLRRAARHDAETSRVAR
jgi:lipopolysaccharide assembly protein A